MLSQPELLSPAGNLETLKYAVLFGADAVYCALPEFGMRAAPVNFTPEELAEGCIFAHARGKKFYLTLNTLPTNEELDRLPQAIRDAAAAGVDAFIVADLGVVEMVKQYAPDVDIHFSTQAGIANYAAATAAWHLGAKRVVLSRELTLTEIAQIRDNTPPELELEAFVHGAMCMSVSGRCLLSSYMTGRSGNRGECAQPCRWKYYLVEERRPGQYMEIGETGSGSYILNANDLCTAPFIDLICKAGIDSLKIEGRAKTFYYVASVTSAYRRALDAYLKDPASDSFDLPDDVIDELNRTSHRHYSPGFYFGKEQALQNALPHLCAGLGFHRHGGFLGEWHCRLYPAGALFPGRHAGGIAARRHRGVHHPRMDQERGGGGGQRHPAPHDALHHPLPGGAHALHAAARP